METEEDKKFEDFAFQNSPANYAPILKEHSRELLYNIRSNLKRSVENVDLDASIFYIRRLQGYLELKYSISRWKRVEIANCILKVLFELPIDYEEQTQAMQCIERLIQREHLSTHGLELDWKPFYNLVKSAHYSSNGVKPSERSKIMQRHETALTNLIERARSYFKPGCMKEILDELLPYLNPFDIYYTFGVSMIELFMPTKQHWVRQEINDYKITLVKDDMRSKYNVGANQRMPDLVLYLIDQALNENLWVKGASDSIFNLLARIIKDNRGIFNIEPFLPQFFHCIYTSIGFPISRQYCPISYSSRLQEGNFPRTGLGALQGFDYAYLCGMLLYCMDSRGDNDPIQEYFIEFFDKIKNYVYPDEQRKTSTFGLKFSQLLALFSTEYVSRYWKEMRGDGDLTSNNKVEWDDELKQQWNWHSAVDREHPLYREVPKELRLKPSQRLVQVLLPILKWCIYAKSMSVKMSAFGTIKALSSIYPKIVLEWAMPEIHECLTSVTESHRLSIGIALLGSVTKTLINNQVLPGFQSQLPSFLKAVLFGIDPSLTQQTVTTLMFYEAIFARIPLISAQPKLNLSKPDSILLASDNKSFDDGINPARPNAECKLLDENDASAREVTFYFEEFASQFIDKIIEYARNISLGLDSLKNSASQNDSAGLKNLSTGRYQPIIRVFESTMRSFWPSVSASTYAECARKVISSILKAPSVGGLQNKLLLSMVDSHPQFCIKEMLPSLVNKILDRDGGNEAKNKEIDIDNFDIGAKYRIKGSKSVVMYYFELLAALLRAGNCHLIPYIPVIATIINSAIEHEYIEIQRFSGALMEACVGSLTRERPIERRPFSKTIWNNFDSNKNGNDNVWRHWNQWALYTELELKGFKQGWRPKLHLDWYFPGVREFEALQQLIDLTLTGPIKSILQFCEHSDAKESNAASDANEVTADVLMQYVGLIYNFTFGLGHLGDFDEGKEDSESSSKFEPFERLYSLQSSKYNVPLYYYKFPKVNQDENGDKQTLFKDMCQLRNLLRIPVISDAKDQTSLRTALARLCIKLFERCNEAYQSSKKVGGISKVLLWLCKLSRNLFNQDGVNWAYVASNMGRGGGFVNTNAFSADNPNGIGKDTRRKWIHEEVGMHYRRVYHLYTHNHESKEVLQLFEQIRKVSMIEVDNVRLNAIQAFTSARCVINFKKACQENYVFYQDVLKNAKAEKHELLAACDFFKSTNLLSGGIVLNVARTESFLVTLLGCSQHPEPLVQDSIHRLFLRFMRDLRFLPIHISTHLTSDPVRQKELTLINTRLRKTYLSLMNTLVNLAITFNDSQLSSLNNIKSILKDSNSPTNANLSPSPNETNSTHSTASLSSSYVNVNTSPPAANNGQDPVVTSLGSLLSSLDLSSLRIDFNQIKNLNLSKDSLLKLLQEQGINLPPSVMADVTDSQIQAILGRTGIPQRIAQLAREKSAELDAKDPNNPNASNSNINSHWRYQLMASVLLVRFMRADVAPSQKIVEYLLTLLKNDVRSMRRVGIMGLMVLFGNNVPLLHFKNFIKNVSEYPNDNNFAQWNPHLTFQCMSSKNDSADSVGKRLTCNNIGTCSMPVFLGNSNEYLGLETALYLRSYLNDANNLDTLLSAFETDHPRMPEPGTGAQNGASRPGASIFSRRGRGQARRSDKADAIVSFLSFRTSWPYDGWGVKCGHYERSHVLLIRDILRAQWPKDVNDYHYQSNNVTLRQWDGRIMKSLLERYNKLCERKKEKEAMLVASELFAGVLRALHQFDAIQANPIDCNSNWEEWQNSGVGNNFRDWSIKAMKTCPAESESAWVSGITIALHNSDPDRVRWITQPILKWAMTSLQSGVAVDENGNGANVDVREIKDAPEKQVRSLACVSEVLLCHAFRARNEVNYVLRSMLTRVEEVEEKGENAVAVGLDGFDKGVVDCFACNEYKSVREKIGFLMACLVRSTRTQVSHVFETYDCLTQSPQLKFLFEELFYKLFVQLWNDYKDEQKTLQAAVGANEDEAKNENDNEMDTEENADPAGLVPDTEDAPVAPEDIGMDGVDGVDGVAGVAGGEANGSETDGKGNGADGAEADAPARRKLNRFLQSVCFICVQLIKTQNMVFFSPILVKMLPLVLVGQYRKDDYTARVTNYVANLLAWAPYRKNEVADIVEYLLVTNLAETGGDNENGQVFPKLLKSDVWNTRKLVLRFLVLFVARNSYQMSVEHCRKLLDYVCDTAMRDDELNVRIEARNVLITLIQSNRLFGMDGQGEEEIKNLINKFNKLCRTKLPKSKLNVTKEEDFDNEEYYKKLRLKLKKKHAGILGYSALILSYPYTLPSWMPEGVAFLTNFERERVPISSTVKAVIGEFKRTHRDEWESKFKQQFTQEQLDDIRDVSSLHNYFV